MPGGLLPSIAGSGYYSQLELNHRHGIKVANYINQFMKLEDFKGKGILELGPGHYSFSQLARSRGAEFACGERNEGFFCDSNRDEEIARKFAMFYSGGSRYVRGIELD